MQNFASFSLNRSAVIAAVETPQLTQKLDETGSPEVGGEWLEEIRRRDADVSAGRVQCASAEDVMRRARERVQ